jgi:hypothetical protein
MPSMKRVLIVSPYFPPSMLAGVHRARHLAKHLPATGWQPIVLCVHESFHKETIDPELAALLPADLEVVKTRALPAQLTRLAGIGDLSLRAFFHLGAALRRILDARPVDAIFITGSPYYPMLLSGWLKRRYGKPIILDFQDPWVSNYGAAQPRFTKSGLAHWLAIRLEPRALRFADFVTSVSDVQNAEMARRYPWLDAGKMAAIPIGGDPDDYARSRARPPNNMLWPRDCGHIHFSYVGTFLPRSPPTARALFAALAQLRSTAPDLANRLRFNFVGTSNQPDDRTSYRFRRLAEAAGVGDLVAETPQRVPFLDALEVLANSDVVLLLGSDEPHYTASKIYPGLISGRPFLSLFHGASSAHRILADAGGGYAFSFTTPDELAALPGRLAAAIRDLATAPDAVGKLRQETIEPYSAPAIARRFADIFAATSA